MSVQRMRRRFAVQLRILIWIFAPLITLGLLITFTPGMLRGPDQGEEGAEAAGQEVIAQVDGKPLTRDRLEQHFDHTVAQVLPFYFSLGQPVGLDRIWEFRLDAMEQAIVRELLVQQAASRKLSVSRKEIERHANQLADAELSRLKGMFKPEELESRLAELVARTDGTLRDRVSEGWFRRWMVERLLKQSDQLGEDLLVQKLREKVLSKPSVTQQDLLASYDEATVRQIEVLLRPEGKPQRTEEQAGERAAQLAARAKRGEDFEALVRISSDDPNAENTGGLIASVRRGMMPQEWEKAVFALAPGETSDPVKLSWGYVIVKMEKLERKLPKDFQKNEQQLMAAFVQRRQEEAWREYQGKLRPEAKVEVLDPEMRAWQALQQGSQEEALPELREAAAAARERQGLAAAAIFYQLAVLLSARQEWEAAIDAYASSHDALTREVGAELPGARAQALVGMAQGYEHQGKTDDALLWYRAAGEASEVPLVHEQLRSVYERLGQKDLVAGEEQWLDDYEKAQLERQKALDAQQNPPAAGAAPPAAPEPENLSGQD